MIPKHHVQLVYHLRCFNPSQHKYVPCLTSKPKTTRHTDEGARMLMCLDRWNLRSIKQPLQLHWHCYISPQTASVAPETHQQPVSISLHTLQTHRSVFVSKSSNWRGRYVSLVKGNKESLTWLACTYYSCDSRIQSSTNIFHFNWTTSRLQMNYCAGSHKLNQEETLNVGVSGLLVAS